MFTRISRRLKFIAFMIGFIVGVFGAYAFGQTLSLAGHARAEITEPYTDYRVQIRDVESNLVVADTQLDNRGEFRLSNLPPSNLLVELTKGQDVICMEGPFRETREKIVIDCGKPVAPFLLATAVAAGVSVGLIGGDAASGSR